MFLASSYYYPSYATSSSVDGATIWIVVSAVLALVGGIALYFTVFSKGNDGKFKGFLGWVYDFFRFRKLMLEDLLKITYLVLAIFMTLFSFALIPTSYIGFLVTLVLGNVLLRASYELMILQIQICKNTTEINKKFGNKKETK